MAFAFTIRHARHRLHLSYSVFRSLRCAKELDRDWKICTLCAVQIHTEAVETPTAGNSPNNERKIGFMKDMTRAKSKENQLHNRESRNSSKYHKRKDFGAEQTLKSREGERANFYKENKTSCEDMRNQTENPNRKEKSTENSSEEELLHFQSRRSYSDVKNKQTYAKPENMKGKAIGGRDVYRNSLKEHLDSGAKRDHNLAHDSVATDTNDCFGNFNREDLSFLKGKFPSHVTIEASSQPDDDVTFGDLLTKKEVTPGVTYSDFKEKDKRFKGEDFDKTHRVLKQVDKYQQAWYKQRIKEYGRKGMVQEAIVVVYKWMLQNERVKPSRETFNELLFVLSRVGYLTKAFGTFDLMRRLGSGVNHYTYSALFNVCANCPEPETDGVERAKRLWQTCVDTEVRMTMILYITAIKAFALGNDMQMALALADEAQKKFRQDRVMLVDALIKGCQKDPKNGCLHAVAIWRLFSKKNKGFKPDVYLYNNLLIAIRHGGISSMEKFQQMLDNTAYKGASCQFSQLPHGKRTSVHTVHGAHSGGSRDGLAAKHTLHVSEPIVQGALPDSTQQYSVKDLSDKSVQRLPERTSTNSMDTNNHWLQQVLYKEVLNDSVVSQDTKLEWWQIAEIEEKKTPGPPALVSTGLDPLTPPSDVVIEGNFPDILNPMESLSGVVSVSEAKKCEDRINLFGGVKGMLVRMDTDGVAPDIRTFGQLLYVAPSTLQAEEALIKYMEDKGVKPDLEFCNYLIWKRCARKDYVGAKAVLDLISQHGMVPNIVSLTCLTKTCTNVKEAFDHMEAVLRGGMNPDVLFFVELLLLECANRSPRLNKAVLQEMAKLNIQPNKTIISLFEGNLLAIQRFIDKKGLGDKEVQESLDELQTFYRQWLQGMELAEEKHPWKAFHLTKISPKTKEMDEDLEAKTLPS